MTLDKMFEKYGVAMSNGTVDVAEFRIFVSFDSCQHVIYVENNNDHVRYECPTIRGAINHIRKDAEDLLDISFKGACEDIAQDLFEQGLPSWGSTYDLQVEDLRDWYDEIRSQFDRR